MIEDCVESDDQFSDAGDDGHFVRISVLPEPIVELADDTAPSSGHVQRFASGGTASVDATFSFLRESSAISAFPKSDLSNRQCFVRTRIPLYKSSNSLIDCRAS